MWTSNEEPYIENQNHFLKRNIYFCKKNRKNVFQRRNQVFSNYIFWYLIIIWAVCLSSLRIFFSILFFNYCVFHATKRRRKRSCQNSFATSFNPLGTIAIPPRTHFPRKKSTLNSSIELSIASLEWDKIEIERKDWIQKPKSESESKPKLSP